MIETNRLIELIKQNATIYYADKETNFPIPIFLNEKNLVKKEEGYGMDIISTEDLYETEKQAEWALKYQRIPRTEYLDLPTWEEFITDDKYKYHYGLSFFDFDNYRLIACIPTEDDNTEFIGIDVDGNTELYHWGKATEENYIKACDLCVKLFKGE